MKNELKNIEIRKKDFIESWDLTENFYKEYPDDLKSFTDDALRLISEMRKLNLDKELRAGQSLWIFVLSRNRWNGLNSESHIKITFLGKNKMIIDTHLNGKKRTQKSDVTYEGYLEKMTNKLIQEKIILNEYNDDEFDTLLNL